MLEIDIKMKIMSDLIWHENYIFKEKKCLFQDRVVKTFLEKTPPPNVSDMYFKGYYIVFTCHLLGKL